MVIHFHRVSFFTEFLHPTSIPLSRATHQEILLPKETGVINLLAQGLQISEQFSYSEEEEEEHGIPGTRE